MTKIALIPPIKSVMRYCANRPVQLALAHLIATEPDYAKAYQQLVRSSHTILDNGAWEGSSLSIAELCDIGEYLRMQTLVLPDCLRDMTATEELSADALHYVTKRYKLAHPWEYAFVIQGTCLPEFYKSITWAVQQDQIRTIMLPKLMEPLVPGGRAGFLTWLQTMRPMVYTRAVRRKIHFLGVWNNPLEIMQATAAHPGVVNSADTALPFHMAYAGALMSSTFGFYGAKSKRPDNYFDHEETEEEMGMAGANVQILDLIAVEVDNVKSRSSRVR